MTPDDLTRWEQLCDAASAGPWRDDEDVRAHPNGDPYHTVWGPKGIGYGSIVTSYPCRPKEASANRAFIAAAREAMPQLIAEVRRLQRRVQGLQDAMRITHQTERL